MNVIIYTNCQGAFIYDNFLSKIIKPKSYNYLICYIYSKDNLDLPIDILSECDLFIYQIVDSKNGIYNTENNEGILKYLPEKCKKISFPSIYANIFPIYREGDKFVGAESIIELKNSGLSLDEVLKKYKNLDINFNLKKRFESSLNGMRIRERICDITLTDFIEENIRKYKLFETQNHINGLIGAHLSNKILEEMNINHTFDIHEYSNICLPGNYGYSDYMNKELGIFYNDHKIDYTDVIINIYNGIFQPKIKEYDCW
jgi:hypothetical protein